MTRPQLAQVTLCAIDCQAPALALQSLLRSLAQVRFGRVCLFTHDWLPAIVVPEVEIIDIEPIRTPAEHSQFVMRQLPHFIRSSHALITRWDAAIRRPAAWTDEFLVHDFVGAPTLGHVDDPQVGSGAFSLRSRRFLRAGLDVRITDEHPEDEVMCLARRAFLQEVHGVSFAPVALAQRFVAVDEDAAEHQFAALGAALLPQWLDEEAMLETVDRLAAGFVVGEGTGGLARALQLRGMPTATERLLARRQALGGAAIDPGLVGDAARALGRLLPSAQ
jgi:hypothetical protein